MPSKKNRTMPWAAAAASLTFGAGACEDGAPTNDKLAAQGADYSETLCAKLVGCDPEHTAPEVEDCEEYYASLFSASYFASWQEGVSDSGPCRAAIEDALECYTRHYTGQSCEEFAAGDDAGDSECAEHHRALQLRCPGYDEDET